jgi:RNA polymerase sigma-70 factor (ECF subfamily)
MSIENTTYLNYLIEISKTGRQRGFLDLCQITLPNVYTTILRLMNNLETAKTVTVKTYLTAWKEIKNFNEKIPLIIWLKNIAINLAMEELSVRHFVTQKETTTEENLSELEILERAIQNLPFEERIVFVLHDLEGYSFNEIKTFFPDSIIDELKTNLTNARNILIEKLFS